MNFTQLDIPGLERNILPKINLQMIRQRGLVDILMVIGFANEVDNSLDNQTKEKHRA